MDEYIEREAAIRDVVETVESGLAVTSDDLAEVLGDIMPADVAPAEELALLEAKNEVLAQENDRLKAEIDRLHKENFWLTGHGNKQNSPPP